MELTLNPSLEKRGALKSFHPFSFEEKGTGDEFLLLIYCYNFLLNRESFQED